MNPGITGKIVEIDRSCGRKQDEFDGEWKEGRPRILPGACKNDLSHEIVDVLDSVIRKNILFGLLNIIVRCFAPGEGQRKVGVPAASELIRQGLKAMEQSSQHMYSISFAELETEKQKNMIKNISEDKAESSAIWNGVPQKALFEKLMRLTVESYCSHPQVWSDIGYAGPAYPRGYVRTQLGQLDPWEAKTENEA